LFFRFNKSKDFGGKVIKTVIRSANLDSWRKETEAGGFPEVGFAVPFERIFGPSRDTYRSS
jgi:hypothetical protein